MRLQPAVSLPRTYHSLNMPSLPKSIKDFGEAERKEMLAAFKDIGIDLTGLDAREKGNFSDISSVGRTKVLELLYALRQV